MRELAEELGAGSVREVSVASASSLPDESADLVVGCWSVFRGPEAPERAEAERILRPGGRLVVVHDYGRDEVARLLPADRPEVGAWSHWKGPFLAGGFRVRVIHTRWVFETAPACRDFLVELVGTDGAAQVPARAHLTYNVALYHRSVG